MKLIDKERKLLMLRKKKANTCRKEEKVNCWNFFHAALLLKAEQDISFQKCWESLKIIVLSHKKKQHCFMTGISHDVDWNLSSEILYSFHHSLCVHSDAVVMILLLSCWATNGKQQAGSERLVDLLPWCRGCSWKGDCLNLKSERANTQKLLFSDLWGFICIHNFSCMFTKLCLLKKEKKRKENA